MKDEPFLDSVGPVFILTSVLAVAALATWLMVRGQGDWGHTPERGAAHPAVAEAPSH